MSIPQTILDIAEICAGHGVQKVIVSPGSRNAPLTLAFSRHPKMNTYCIGDERAAGYIGLGMSQSLKQPVVLISTSGTAALNYGPAVAEAYYQRVPLLIFTADRPPEWIDQNDGQAIRQRNIFINHTKQSFEMPVSMDHQDAKWQVHRIVNEANIVAISGNPGPVHINVPLREPLYPASEQTWKYQTVPVVNYRVNKKNLTQSEWDKLKQQWANARNILIVGGHNPFSLKLVNVLDKLQKHAPVPVIGDVVSNLHTVTNVITHPEIILSQNRAIVESFQPDLLITFGGSVISKNLKLFLRKFPASIHWHLQGDNYPADPFKSLSDILPMDPIDFFSKLSEYIPASSESPWYQAWQKQQILAGNWVAQIPDANFNELKVVQQVLSRSTGMHIHLSNSAPVRWADLVGVAGDTQEVTANRGTSGIDGCSSAAVGHAMTNQRSNLLLTGDMAFLYDRNAFWHNYPLENLKIVVLNNHGGGIFRLLEGPSNQPELEDLFVTDQRLGIKNTAQDFNMKYLYCDNYQDLTVSLDQLLKPCGRVAVLEVELPNNMGEIYRELTANIREL